MHDTAFAIGCAFFETYLADRPAEILEIGSREVNGGLRQGAPPGAAYIGVDLVPGPGVDLVLENAYALPFAGDRFDAIVASSCFEHVAMFWLTFLEMVRVTKPGGFIYINAPSNGEYHRYPIDAWRFYPDAALALLTWAGHQGLQVEIVESFIAPRSVGGWNDCVMIFGNRTTPQTLPARRVADRFAGSSNIRRAGHPDVACYRAATDDMILLDRARQGLVGRVARRLVRAAIGRQRT
jgi:SAM-dependent methyltransferase